MDWLKKLIEEDPQEREERLKREKEESQKRLKEGEWDQDRDENYRRMERGSKKQEASFSKLLQKFGR